MHLQQPSPAPSLVPAYADSCLRTLWKHRRRMARKHRFPQLLLVRPVRGTAHNFPFSIALCTPDIWEPWRLQHPSRYSGPGSGGICAHHHIGVCTWEHHLRLRVLRVVRLPMGAIATSESAPQPRRERHSRGQLACAMSIISCTLTMVHQSRSRLVRLRELVSSTLSPS